MNLNFDSDDEEIISLTGGPRQPAFQQPVFQQLRPRPNMPANGGGYKKKRTNKNSKKYKNKNKNKNRKRQTNRVRKAK
jgi:hypothetical protein